MTKRDMFIKWRKEIATELIATYEEKKHENPQNLEEEFFNELLDLQIEKASKELEQLNSVKTDREKLIEKTELKLAELKGVTINE